MKKNIPDIVVLIIGVILTLIPFIYIGNYDAFGSLIYALPKLMSLSTVSTILLLGSISMTYYVYGKTKGKSDDFRFATVVLFGISYYHLARWLLVVYSFSMG